MEKKLYIPNNIITNIIHPLLYSHKLREVLQFSMLIAFFETVPIQFCSRLSYLPFLSYFRNADPFDLVNLHNRAMFAFKQDHTFTYHFWCS
jgi:hypothetical protein